MSATVFYKLLAIVAVVALGWTIGKLKWLSHANASDADPARTLSNAALYIFIPALLFRTTARIQYSALPWATLAAFFIPVLVLLLSVYAWQRRWKMPAANCAVTNAPAPSIRWPPRR